MKRRASRWAAGLLVVGVAVPVATALPASAAGHLCGGLPATIVGTAGNDTITGTSGTDVIVGLGGNDKLRGMGGNDVLCGGGGNDVLQGGNGNDVLLGQGGANQLRGGNGFDSCDVGDGGSARQCENTAPVAVDDGYDTDEDTALAVPAPGVLGNDTDPDADTLSVIAVDDRATIGLVTVNPDGSFTYDPNGQFESLNNGDTATDTFTYTASDGNGRADTATVTITIDGVTDNFPPDARDDGVTTDEDTPLNGEVFADNGNGVDSDPDADPITVTEVDGNAGDVGVPVALTSGALLIVNSNGTFTYDPNGQFESLGTGQSVLDSFMYTIADSPVGAPDSAAVTVTVTGVDDPPVAVNDVATVGEDAPATAINVLANDTDPDGGTTTINSVTQPANGTVTITGLGTGLTYQPNSNYCNNGTPTDNFAYTLSPGGSTATVSVTVTCVNYDMVVEKTATPTDEPQDFNPNYILGGVFAGGTIGYTVTVSNLGPDTAPAGAVSLGDGRDDPLDLQGTLDLSGAPQFNPSCVVGPDNPPQFNKSFTCTNQGGEFDPNGASASATIAYTAEVETTTPAGTLVCNSATVTVIPFGADTTLANNEYEVCNTVVTASDLTVIKSGPPSAQANSNLTYSIVVSNLGPQAALSPSLYEVVPADTTFESITAPLGWACYDDATNTPLTTGLPAGTVIRCDGPQSFSFPGTAVFTYVVQVVASPVGVSIENNFPVTIGQDFFGNGACIVPGTENFVDANGNQGEINDDLNLANNCDQESTPFHVFAHP